MAEWKVFVELVGPPASDSEEPRRMTAEFAATTETDEPPTAADLRVAVAQTRAAHAFVARVDGESSAAVIEEINLRVEQVEASA